MSDIRIKLHLYRTMPGMDQKALRFSRHMSDMQPMHLSSCTCSHVGYKKHSRSVTCPGQRAHLKVSRFVTCPGQHAHSSSSRLATCPGQCAHTAGSRPAQGSVPSIHSQAKDLPRAACSAFASADCCLLRAAPSSTKVQLPRAATVSEWLSPETMMRSSTTRWKS